jgi:hypothetical protein
MKCEKIARVKAARDARREARGTRYCESCEKEFTPTRTDAQFCCGACRQKAYRRSVTDNAGPPRRPNKKRNAP